LRRFTTLAERLAAEDAEGGRKGGKLMSTEFVHAHTLGVTRATDKQVIISFTGPGGRKVAIVSISPSVARFLALDLLEAAGRLERADR